MSVSFRSLAFRARPQLSFLVKSSRRASKVGLVDIVVSGQRTT